MSLNRLSQFRGQLQSLLDSLTKAGTAITNSQNTAAADGVKLDFCQLTITNGFSVTTTVSGGLTVPLLVAPAANLGHSNDTVQQVKLTFKVKDQDPKVCAAKP